MNTQDQCNTVVILCAGSGGRLKPYTNYIHKSLLPINSQAILTKIINRFPKNFKFIIPVGSKKDQIIYFCKTVHKNLKFTFVNINNFNKKGSGPGLSLLKCKKYINGPFYLTTCDTLFGKINFNKDKFKKQNWVAISDTISSNATKDYCCFKINKNKIIKIFDKRKNIRKLNPFIGLCKVYNYKIFFKYLSKSILIKNEKQLSSGLQGIIDQNNLYYKHTYWEDLGNKKNYEFYKKKNEQFDFSKKNELLYLNKPNTVGKFFVDKNTTKLRFERAKLFKSLAPKLISNFNNFYFYSWVEGKTLYEKCEPKLFYSFLNLMENKLWKKRKKIYNFNKYCKKFYELKTKERIKDFKKKYPKFDKNFIINGEKIPKIEKIFKLINWKYLFDGVPVNFHGDLQFDNILFNSKFKLIDWRESFSGCKQGDLYYDLAKLLGGLIINYKKIKKNKFSYINKKNKIKIILPKFKNQIIYKKILIDHIKKNGYDFKKVKIIVSLIYLNMSPLHNYPFDKMLFCLGKKMLWNNLKKFNENK